MVSVVMNNRIYSNVLIESGGHVTQATFNSLFNVKCKFGNSSKFKRKLFYGVKLSVFPSYSPTRRSLEIWMRARWNERAGVNRFHGRSRIWFRSNSLSGHWPTACAVSCFHFCTRASRKRRKRIRSRISRTKLVFGGAKPSLRSCSGPTRFFSSQYQRLIVGRVMRMTPILFFFFFFSFFFHLLFRGISFGKIKSAEINRRLRAWLQYASSDN